MRVFIDFWKLETENNLLHVFSFLHKLSFENSFCFLPVLSCQTSFLVSKIENCFWKQKTREKNSYQTYPYFFSISWVLFCWLLHWLDLVFVWKIFVRFLLFCLPLKFGLIYVLFIFVFRLHLVFNWQFFC